MIPSGKNLLKRFLKANVQATGLRMVLCVSFRCFLISKSGAGFWGGFLRLQRCQVESGLVFQLNCKRVYYGLLWPIGFENSNRSFC